METRASQPPARFGLRRPSTTTTAFHHHDDNSSNTLPFALSSYWGAGEGRSVLPYILLSRSIKRFQKLVGLGLGSREYRVCRGPLTSTFLLFSPWYA